VGLGSLAYNDIIRNYDGKSFIIHDLGKLCQCFFEPWFKIVSSMIFDPSVGTSTCRKNFKMQSCYRSPLEQNGILSTVSQIGERLDSIRETSLILRHLITTSLVVSKTESCDKFYNLK
jgi:hypothetical protein